MPYDFAERLRQLPEEMQLAFVKLPQEVRNVFVDPECGMPNEISKKGCLALAKLGKGAWNAWREAFPAKVQFNGRGNSSYFYKENIPDQFIFLGFNFGDLASFYATKFGDLVCFENASFGRDTYFSKAIFGESVSFRRCKGQGFISFDKTTWNGNAFFDGAVFDADFSHATFTGYVSFVGYSTEKAISFRGATFAKGADFSNTKLKGKTDFSNVTFGKAPLFHGCEIHQDTFFEGATFPAATGDEEAERAYRTLKLAFSKYQAIREEQRFFRLEMAEEALRHKGAKRALFWLYKTSSDYGFSLKRPCVALLSIFVFMAAIYGLPSLFGQTCKDACTFSPQWLSFSLLQTLPILGMDKLAWDLHTAFWPKGDGWESLLILLVVIHKTLSLVAFFLIGLALRNLFKLK